MKAIKISLLAFLTLFMAQSCSANNKGEQQTTSDKKTQQTTSQKSNKKEGDETKVKIETSMGNIVVKLYNGTPKHRDNFIKLVQEGYYEGVLFHRVIPNFMIQTGDPDSKTAQPGQPLGMGGPGYTIPAEFVYPQYFHKKGALAAARTGDQVNPEKASSGSQFYIVTGNVLDDAALDNMENGKRGSMEQALFQKKVNENMALIQEYQNANNQAGLQALQNRFISEIQTEMASTPPFKFTPEQRQAYKTVGGTPFLDDDYTVFGEIVEGMDVIDKISAAQTAPGDRPVEDIKIIKATIVK